MFEVDVESQRFSKETCLKAVALRAVDYSKYTLALEEGNSLAHNCTSLTLCSFCGCHGNYGCLTPREKNPWLFIGSFPKTLLT